jgi:hypothetical protein
VVPGWLAEVVRPRRAPVPWPEMIRAALAICVPLSASYAAGLAIGAVTHGHGWLAVVALVAVAGVSGLLSARGDIGSVTGLQLLVYTSLGADALLAVSEAAAGSALAEAPELPDDETLKPVTDMVLALLGTGERLTVLGRAGVVGLAVVGWPGACDRAGCGRAGRIRTGDLRDPKLL